MTHVPGEGTMIGILMFFVMLVGVLALGVARRRDSAASHLALHLGLQFDRYVLGTRQAPTEPSLTKPTGSPLARVLPIVHTSDLTGLFNGVRVRVVLPAAFGDEHTRLYGSFEPPLNSGLRISRAVGADRIAHSVFGMQDLKSGNDKLDRLVVIQARAVPEAQAIVRDPDVQQMLLQLFESSNVATVLEDEIRIQVKGAHNDPERTRAALDVLTRTVLALDRARRQIT